MSRSACFRVPAIAAALLTLGALALSPASAQQVRGTITDGSAGSPLAGALVALFDADSVVRATTLSDHDGAFLLPAPPGDTLQLRVQRIGYAPLASVPILLEAGDSVRLEIRMRPQPVALEGVTATGESLLDPDLRRFLHRKRNGFGRVFGVEEMARVPGPTTTTLLTSLPGTFLFPGANGTLLAKPLGSPSSCSPRIYLDGFRLDPTPSAGMLSRGMGVRVDGYVHPGEILGVEVYRNPAQAPAEFQEAFGAGGCAIVLIWTELSFGRVGAGG